MSRDPQANDLKSQVYLECFHCIHHQVPDRQLSWSPPNRPQKFDTAWMSAQEPKAKRRRVRPPRRIAWCDGRFRCSTCVGGMGPDGRGYTRARNVPCVNPDKHLTVSDCENCDRYWMSNPDAVHFDLPNGRRLNRETGDVAKPGPDGWCIACDAHGQYTNGRPRPPTYTIPLDAHVGPWPEHWVETEAVRHLQSGPLQRARKSQLPWCDGLYRCAYCCPTGQSRPIGRAQCSDPSAHMPTGVRGQFVHFLTASSDENALRTGNARLLDVCCARVAGCGRCANDGMAFPPSPRRIGAWAS
jgi:hypothetical protein